MALKLNLKPGERFVLNGTVLTNGDRRATLTVETRASVLRERDIMAPADATSPARRLYFTCMLAYIEPDKLSHRDTFVELMGDLIAALASPAAKLACVEASKLVLAGRHYQALAHCRTLIDYEASVMAAAPEA